jgi:prevent-host-death family protein
MVRNGDVTSVNNHRDHLAEHLQQVRDTGRPMFITTDGETEAVVLSPTTYDKLAEDAELARSLTMLDRSIDDIKAGRVQDAKQAIDEIAAELGLSLERNPARG